MKLYCPSQRNVVFMGAEFLPQEPKFTDMLDFCKRVPWGAIGRFTKRCMYNINIFIYIY